MANKLCRMVKKGLLKEDIDEYKKYVKKPKFLCKSCGRIASKSDDLCKSEKI